jgi:peptidoglycan/LPS O-acetylase OafA/YrhL
VSNTYLQLLVMSYDRLKITRIKAKGEIAYSIYVLHTVMKVYIQYKVYVYDLCMFIRYLVSITQVLKDI